MNDSSSAERRLSVLDCASILIGIIIGSGIYESAGLVAAQLETPAELAGVWIAGAVFAFLGALCYAELAVRFPDHGGDYVYLSQAFGRLPGFLFAWTQLWVIRPGSIGAMACVFANYAAQLVPLGEYSFLFYACGSIAVLSIVNMLGVRQGIATQNLLSAAKILGLGALIIGGLVYGGNANDGAAAIHAVVDPHVAPIDRWSFAMIFVLFAYSGCNEMGCVAAEVRDPNRNLLRALLLGTTVVALAYLGMNAACWNVLGLGGMARSEAVAAETARVVAGDWGARALSLLICISALGSTNGMIFTGARIYYAMGQRHAMFSPLARWSPRFGTPIASLTLQTVVTTALVLGFGWSAGDAPRQAFGRLVMFMTPPFYLFLIGSAAATIRFRRQRVGNDSGFRMPWFPLPPLIVGLAAVFMTYRGVEYIRFNYLQQGDRLLWPAAWVVVTFATGILFALLDRGRGATK